MTGCHSFSDIVNISLGHAPQSYKPSLSSISFKKHQMLEMLEQVLEQVVQASPREAEPTKKPYPKVAPILKSIFKHNNSIRSMVLGNVS